MSLTLYGIPNCDTVKKVRAALDAKQLPYQFHDFKKQGVPVSHLDHWLAALGWEVLLNRKGTTWRKLDETTRAHIVDTATAKAVMLEHPSIIKRPVIEKNDQVVGVGLDGLANLTP